MNFIDTFLNIDVIMRVFPMLVRGIGNTVALATSIIIGGGIVGVLICLVRLYAPKPFRWLAIAYVDVFRAIPILVLLILIYYALPFMGIRLNAFMSATTALGLVFSSFTAEVFRSGIQAIPQRPNRSCRGTGAALLGHRVENLAAASLQNRDPAPHVKCRGHRKRHLPRVSRRHARFAQASHRRASPHRKPITTDRSCNYVSDRTAPRRETGFNIGKSLSK